MAVESLAECSKHSAILPTFIELPFVIKIFVLSIFEWPFYTGITVNHTPLGFLLVLMLYDPFNIVLSCRDYFVSV